MYKYGRDMPLHHSSEIHIIVTEFGCSQEQGDNRYSRDVKNSIRLSPRLFNGDGSNE